MNVLYLYGDKTSDKIWNTIRDSGCVPNMTNLRLTFEGWKNIIENVDIDWVISFGYKYILSDEVINLFGGRIINIHISYLPWNRGADPNFWSWVDDTPKGVSIHFMDRGIDTGDLIAQYQVLRFPFISQSELTLRNTYDYLILEAENLFALIWRKLLNGELINKKQEGQGSYHSKKDIEKYRECMPNGWDTKIEELMDCAGEVQMSKDFWDKYDEEIAEIQRSKK